VIKFNSFHQSFRIKDLSAGTGTFARISESITLKRSNIISFSDSHMIVEIDEALKISIKFVDGPMEGNYFEFVGPNSPVLVGRMKDCQI
jgi:hypothetical protein